MIPRPYKKSPRWESQKLWCGLFCPLPCASTPQWNPLLSLIWWVTEPSGAKREASTKQQITGAAVGLRGEGGLSIWLASISRHNLRIVRWSHGWAQRLLKVLPLPWWSSPSPCMHLHACSLSKTKTKMKNRFSETPGSCCSSNDPRLSWVKYEHPAPQDRLSFLRYS